SIRHRPAPAGPSAAPQLLAPNTRRGRGRPPRLCRPCRASASARPRPPAEGWPGRSGGPGGAPRAGWVSRGGGSRKRGHIVGKHSFRRGGSLRQQSSRAGRAGLRRHPTATAVVRCTVVLGVLGALLGGAVSQVGGPEGPYLSYLDSARDADPAGAERAARLVRAEGGRVVAVYRPIGVVLAYAPVPDGSGAPDFGVRLR